MTDVQEVGIAEKIIESKQQRLDQTIENFNEAQKKLEPLDLEKERIETAMKDFDTSRAPHEQSRDRAKKKLQSAKHVLTQQKVGFMLIGLSLELSLSLHWPT